MKRAGVATKAALDASRVEEGTMRISRIAATFGVAVFVSGAMIAAASAYDGTKCKAPGDCWEPKPGFPEKVAGSKYDPRHDPAELSKNQASIAAMEARNRKRVENFKKTGKFVYDVSKIP
jgi:methanol dehydrogenase (cytochrome c) subunit 2